MGRLPLLRYKSVPVYSLTGPSRHSGVNRHLELVERFPVALSSYIPLSGLPSGNALRPGNRRCAASLKGIRPVCAPVSVVDHDGLVPRNRPQARRCLAARVVTGPAGERESAWRFTRRGLPRPQGLPCIHMPPAKVSARTSGACHYEPSEPDPAGNLATVNLPQSGRRPLGRETTRMGATWSFP